jgi:hypothetical protein
MYVRDYAQYSVKHINVFFLKEVASQSQLFFLFLYY